jgi:regulator of sirC expression with transglutaminase-like and TPR domain
MNGMIARQKFSELVERDHPAPTLAELALWIAAEEYPELDISAYLNRLDKLAERVRRIEARLQVGLIEALRIVLAEEQGFHGNREHYADPRNSFLNEVLDRKTGIPITLSLVYIEVARRLGLEAHGIGFPGHFLAQIRSGDQTVVIDAFHGGRVLAMEECEILLAKMTSNRVTFSPELLLPASWRTVAYRLLANLKNIYIQQPAELQRALGVVDRMLLVQPGSQADVRDRGLIQFQLEQQR